MRTRTTNTGPQTLLGDKHDQHTFSFCNADTTRLAQIEHPRCEL